MSFPKKSKKESREYQALMGLVELYLKSGKPVGSNTLREHGFEALSSATLRNYFAELEKEGYLYQPHSSGGRIPTAKALRLYAEESLKAPQLLPEIEEKLQSARQKEIKNTSAFLQSSAEWLSDVTGYAIFLSAVRFDHDFIYDIKFVSIDHNRALCVLISDFGEILTEILTTDSKLSTFSLKRIERYFQWKLKNLKKEKKPELSYDEELLAQKFYNEIMVRYLVRYSNFSEEEIHRTGFSKLLAYPEFNDPVSLMTGLSLFENTTQMRHLLNDVASRGRLHFWIDSDLAPYASSGSSCSVLAIPYRINHITAGAIGLLGPSRMPYRSLFGTLQQFSDYLSETLTKSLSKFKITFRHPRSGTLNLETQEWKKVDQSSPYLLEHYHERKQ